uniref:PGG domain-containing protein n=1 Tax=Oryza glumipatula TaxID=40148 RepID=A0A0E0BHB4_9ORYZ
MAAGTSSSTSNSTGALDQRLLEAAKSGDSMLMKEVVAAMNPSILLGTTPQGNTCLHISTISGHEEFCKDVLMLDNSLLAIANSHGETPLLTAVTNGRTALASVLLKRCCEVGFTEAILKQDQYECNALHYAIRNGHKDLALELIAAEPGLSQGVNKYGESPMFIAAMRDFTDIFRKLLGIPGSAHVGCYGYNALHAAVRNGNPVIAKELVEERPELAREFNCHNNTPMHLAVLWGKTDSIYLGYALSNNKDGCPLLNSAAYRGYVSVARELVHHCPDAPYFFATAGRSCLHIAVSEGHLEFVKFILESPYLRKLVNMRDDDGNTALHYAVKKCDPRMVAALLSHQDTDVTVLNEVGGEAAWELEGATDYAKTLNWNEVLMLLFKVDPQSAMSVYILHKMAKDKLNKLSMKDAKSLTQTYTSNTSLVAILIATITFAAAFTLPGGYSSHAGNLGFPIMARKFAFQSFLIADTLAMFSSLAVAFICIIARWEDLQFLLHYRSFTKKLMWFAYMATNVAFATGLYTVLAPRLLWLAIGICLLSVLLPAITKLLGEWPVLKLRFRLGKTFNSDLLNMV